MPYLFHEKSAGDWHLLPVAASPSLLRFDPVSVEPTAVTRPQVTTETDTCLLVHDAGQDKWAVVVAEGAAVLHNGARIAAGVRMLEHRDSLGVQGARPMFFTTEDRAHVETYTAAAPVVCPRCRSDVRPGALIVKCPGCGVVHHEATYRNCWTYAEFCALCSQPTALNAGMRWTPGEL